ncbi:MAG: hypothetical protein FJY98_01520 [Candidatus Liptonbacteria bacterium]|nr:hypothetical protein [Candidatus Liptonbacteria bacterium]
MQLLEKEQAELHAAFQKVVDTPPSFDFFEAIHDFVACIEHTSSFADALSPRIKANRELNIPVRYGYLKQIYRGLEDVKTKSNEDLGHARYMVIRELTQIQSSEFSESNSFWRKRELWRRLVGEIYKKLNPQFFQAKNRKKVVRGAA